MMTAAELTKAVEGGRTVYVCTYTRATKITPRTLARWRAVGREIFRDDSRGHVLMARGRHWDDIGGCAIRIV